MLFFGLSLAQRTISGTLYTSEVQGFVIPGCLLNLSTQDCNYDHSPYVTIEQSGPSATYTLQDAPAGNYLVIAWKDKNKNGNLDENVDEVGYYLDSSNEVS